MIGRSGLDKEPARRLVKDLEDAGAEVHITRGDVGDASVVEEAVAAIEGEIGGVVQAAMGLDVCFFLFPLFFPFYHPSFVSSSVSTYSSMLTRTSTTGSNLDLHVQ